MNEALQVDMLAQVKGEAAASLAATNAELRLMESRLKATAGTATKTAAATKDLTAAQRLEATTVGANAKGFQDLTGKVTGFMGAATFAAGAVTGLVAGLVSLIGEQKTLDQQLAESSKAIEIASAGYAKLTAELTKATDAYLNIAAARDGELAGALSAERAAKAEADAAVAIKGRLTSLRMQVGIEQQLLETDEIQLAALRAKEPLWRRQLETLVGGAMALVQRSQREEHISELEAQRARRLSNIERLQQGIAGAMNEQVRAAESLEDTGRWWLSPGSPTPKPDVPQPPKPPTPGRGRGRYINPMAQALADDHAAFLEDQKQRADDAADAVSDYAARLAWAHQGFKEDEKNREDDRIQRQKDAAAADKAAMDDRLRAYLAFSAGLDVYRDSIGSLAEISPGLARVADGLADIAKHAYIAANATDGATEAIFGLVAASGKTALSLVKDTQARALGEALLYTGLATAAAFTPGMQWQAAGYGLAAAQLFIAAGTGGKKGGSAAAAGAANDNRMGGGSGGSITNVYNLGAGSRDAIGMAHLQRRLEGEQRHTGYDQRAVGW